MVKNNENNLISIDEVIWRAKQLGVDFGKGNPRERLRYLTKIGLLPHAKRKSFNGRPPNGAYPEYVIELLREIDREVKAGKSFQEIRRKKERESLIETEIPASAIPQILKKPGAESEKEQITKPSLIKKPEVFFSTFKKLVLKVGGVMFLLFTLGSLAFFFAGQKAIRENFYSYLSASFDWIKKIVQTPPTPTRIEEIPEIKEIFPSVSAPYLTINAETDINAPLNVKEEINTPLLNLVGEEFKGILTLNPLSADRIYNFPDLSGTVCLTTGNCIGLGGEVFAPTGGVVNRLSKFISAREIGVSSIEDLYSGIALTIDSEGKVGIGIREPEYALHIRGRIQATGDICTDLKGGKCLSQLTAPSPPMFIGGGGVGGSGSASYFPIWTNRTTLGDSIVSQSGSAITVDGTINANGINVDGTLSTLAFQLSTGAEPGYILTSDGSGFGSWQPAPTGTLPAGVSGQTLRHNGAGWVPNSFLYNTGSAIGIGTTSTLATLTVAGNGLFQGYLSVVTSTLPQWIVRYDDSNYFEISVTSEGVVLFGSSSGKIRAATNTIFYTDSGHPIRESGEEILRAAVPIFLYDFPAQTNSTSFVKISKHFASTSEISLPASMEGTTRKYRLAIKYADDITPSSYSDWRVVNQSGTHVYDTFTLPGKGMSTFEKGVPYITDLVAIPDNDWQLELKIPAGKTIRVFSIFLLAIDEVN